jgi:hypothetical protein
VGCCLTADLLGVCGAGGRGETVEGVGGDDGRGGKMFWGWGGGGEGATGEGAGRVNARRWRVKGEPMRLS